MKNLFDNILAGALGALSAFIILTIALTCFNLVFTSARLLYCTKITKSYDRHGNVVELDDYVYQCSF